MARILISLWLCMWLQATRAQVVVEEDLQTGDLLFQNLDCGPLCDAIETVTHGYKGISFSHIGLVIKRNDSLYVLEAIGKDVHTTPLPIFVKRSTHRVYIGRVRSKYRYMVNDAVAYANTKAGIAYDDVFLYDNDKYYCSELIYDAFKYANSGKPFFALQPMTFCKPDTRTFFPAWEAYYKDLGVPVPEGKPGINPGGISSSRKIKIIGCL
ncbi:hypothetical protein CAP35_15170 [Chitinophagaceae bacterium IBVUCB1]|nr:hypothetical protein CAP35_15170 [Chitinophagaceae bacterium IBVUCB1]